jgi:hypothetical protein
MGDTTSAIVEDYQALSEAGEAGNSRSRNKEPFHNFCTLRGKR